jgi:hypothetical protein
MRHKPLHFHIFWHIKFGGMQSGAKRYQQARINASDREKDTAQERHLTLIERAERDNDERERVTWWPRRYP